MTETSATLPPDWSAFLADFHQRFAHAVVSTDARLAEIPPSRAEPPAQEQQQVMARLEACLRGSSAHLETAENLAREVDQVLQSSEEALRRPTTLSTSVRQRLAAWAGCAIG